MCTRNLFLNPSSGPQHLSSKVLTPFGGGERAVSDQFLGFVLRTVALGFSEGITHFSRGNVGMMETEAGRNILSLEQRGK